MGRRDGPRLRQQRSSAFMLENAIASLAQWYLKHDKFTDDIRWTHCSDIRSNKCLGKNSTHKPRMAGIRRLLAAHYSGRRPRWWYTAHCKHNTMTSLNRNKQRSTSVRWSIGIAKWVISRQTGTWPVDRMLAVRCAGHSDDTLRYGHLNRQVRVAMLQFVAQIVAT